MATLNSKLILAKGINMDKDYVNVLSYNTTQLLALLNSNAHYVDSSETFSFIGGKNTKIISTPFSYEDCLMSNYIAFQNPSYSNKWFFAFITNVIYRSNGNTQIEFEIDAWSTWFENWTKKPCYILREHVNDDTVGSNTVPENLETGEYFCNEHHKDSTMDNYANDLCFIMASTSEPVTGDAKDTVAPSSIYNGIYTGLSYYRYDATSAIDIILEIFANSGKTDAINGVFMAPKWLAPLSESALRSVAQSNNPQTFNINVSKQNTLNGYTPKNNKLKCFPYNFLIVSNNVGQNAILHYEKFSNSNNATFNVKGVLNPGCSINITPTNYNGNTSSDNDAIQLGKFPICNFQNDMYTNWLTQNSINVLGQNISTDDMNIAGSVLGGISGVATNIGSGNLTGAGMSVASGLSNIASAVMQKKQHNMIPPTVNGQLNSADVNVASGNNTFHFYKMSVKAEFARIIDDYFTRYGYQINRIKNPNITGRQNYNYIEIGSSEEIGNGNVPVSFMSTINNVCRRGVTIWHNHDNMGNYNVSNNIV